MSVGNIRRARRKAWLRSGGTSPAAGPAFSSDRSDRSDDGVEAAGTGEEDTTGASAADEAGAASSFGLTDAVRDWWGINDGINKCGNAYWWGSATGVATDVLSTAASLGLNAAARNVGKQVLNADRKAARRAMGLVVGDGKVAHHINPLKGHPNGLGPTIFPTAGLPGWLKNHPMNLRVVAKGEQNTAEHVWLAYEERFAAGMGLANPFAGVARAKLTSCRAARACQ